MAPAICTLKCAIMLLERRQLWLNVANGTVSPHCADVDINCFLSFCEEEYTGAYAKL